MEIALVFLPKSSIATKFIPIEKEEKNKTKVSFSFDPESKLSI